MEGGAWWATVHGSQSWTRLSDFAFTFTICFEGQLIPLKLYTVFVSVSCLEARDTYDFSLL